jgi:hypothetical protein
MTKVVYKKLRKVWGLAYVYHDRIELYDKMKGKKHLEIILHEKLHIEFPDLDEGAVKRISRAMCKTLWEDGYRKTPL